VGFILKSSLEHVIIIIIKLGVYVYF